MEKYQQIIVCIHIQHLMCFIVLFCVCIHCELIIHVKTDLI